MRLPVRVLLFLLACIVPHARIFAQVEPSAYYETPRLAVGGTFSYFHLNYGSRNLLGGTVIVDAKVNYHVGVEGEMHWLELNQQQDVHEETYLAGPRYVFNPFHGWVPYVNVLAGNGQFNFPYSYAHGGYLALAAGGGIERPLNYRWRLRAVNFEYQHWPGFTGASFSQYGVSSGIEFRIR
jgi:hypothetical protein